MMKRILIGASLALGTATMIAPASAQVNVPVQGGLINVAVTDVTVDALNNNNLLNDVEITALNNLLNNNQLVLQVPIGIAANVCNVAANVLAQGGGLTDGKCTATAPNQAFANLVKRRLPRN